MLIIFGGLAVLGLLFVARPSSTTTRVGADGAPQPAVPIAIVGAIRVTKGTMLPGGKVDVPTFRAVAPGTSGDAVALDFVFKGSSSDARALGSGQMRRQIGLKLRAANGCNLVYVMWRIDPTPQLEVSTKINPGMTVHTECGTHGYTKLGHVSVHAPIVGRRHTLRAEIVGNELSAWIDGQLAWRNTLPDDALRLAGPAGIRSDNVTFDIFTLGAAAGQNGADDTGGED